jgi:mannose-6-phosphate isomerase-like protein (cupin superfamily)
MGGPPRLQGPLKSLVVYADNAASALPPLQPLPLPQSMPTTTTGIHAAAAAAAATAGSVNGSYHRFSLQCGCAQCNGYCPADFEAPKPRQLTAKRRKPGRPPGAHNKSKAPPPPIRAPVAFWNARSQTIEKSVLQGQFHELHSSASLALIVAWSFSLATGGGSALDTFFMPEFIASCTSGSTNDNLFTYNASADGWGHVRLEPGSVGPWQATHRQHYICYVSAGEVAVSFGDGYTFEEEEIAVKKGCVWEVRRGHSFQPRNASRTRPATFVYMKVSRSSPRITSSRHR